MVRDIERFMTLEVLDRTEAKLWYNRRSCNLTNTNLLTIGSHYPLTGSSAFLHFGVSKAQDIGTSNTEMHQKSKKALDLQGLSANF